MASIEVDTMSKISQFRIGKRSAKELVIHVAAIPESSPVLRSALREFLDLHLTDPERRGDLLLAVGEATSNAIEHAYYGRPIAGDICVCARAESGAITIDVGDHGTWREGPSVDRGRGLSIMRALVDRMTIDQEAGGTIVHLQVRHGIIIERSA